MNDDLIQGLFVRDDDEDLFSRDIDGQLVRLDAPVASDYEKTINLQIDGQAVSVPSAEPLKDAQGNIVLDVEGRTTPRYTTIYDAARELYVKQPGDEVKIPIPTLCHMAHMEPVGVCRLCVVQIYGEKRGKRAAERKLLPACQIPVKEGMEVFTMNAEGPDGDRVRQTVKVITELVAADHLKPAEPPELEAELAPFNELGRLTERTAAQPERLRIDAFSAPRPEAPPSKGRRGLDTSSPVFLVDHSACILCDRCVRACDDVQQNHIIGRTGKGASAGISFDLNDPMGASGCVQCGECMVSCPTSAIMFRPGARVKVAARKGIDILGPQELISDPIFAGIAPKFLLWQQGLVTRRRLRAGEILCQQGDAGNTAFLIREGNLGVTVSAAAGRAGFFSRAVSKTVASFELTPANIVAGEMSCMTGTPRTATIRALTDGEVWEVRRNVLDRLMRLPSRRDVFENLYRTRALELVLKESELFKNLPGEDYREIIDHLIPRISFVRVSPGQKVFEQGDRANALYLVRLGHIGIGKVTFGSAGKAFSRGPGTIIGEIGLLGLGRQDLRRSIDEVNDSIGQALAKANGDIGRAVPAGLRTATCFALGHLELARLNRPDFLEMVRRFPAVRRRLIELSFSRLGSQTEHEDIIAEFVAQGLYEAQSALVLDLDRCTRCDECTKACVQQHGEETHGLPLPRLLREGNRFGNFLVATSCRSCTDAHCMVGCPVDSIHRGAHHQIVIEDHCIGCGLCATNCPYGSIFMAPNLHAHETPGHTHIAAALALGQPKAAACDLCQNHGDTRAPAPQCVAACPHDAAFRITGDELLQRVLASQR